MVGSENRLSKSRKLSERVRDEKRRRWRARARRRSDDGRRRIAVSGSERPRGENEAALLHLGPRGIGWLESRRGKGMDGVSDAANAFWDYSVARAIVGRQTLKWALATRDEDA